MVDQRFTDIRPQLADPEHGDELCLRDVLINYYVVRDVPMEKACEYADLYINRWTIAEMFMAEETG